MEVCWSMSDVFPLNDYGQSVDIILIIIKWNKLNICDLEYITRFLWNMKART
jgi:hypothetical protein